MSADRPREASGGPSGGPRPFPGRLARFGLAAVILGGLAGIVVLVSGQLPSGTAAGSLIVRGLVGLAVGLLVIVGVRRVMRSFTEAPPAPPQRLDARSTDVVYECGVCGTRVRLEVASTGKAPRHCGEEMEPEVTSGR